MPKNYDILIKNLGHDKIVDIMTIFKKDKQNFVREEANLLKFLITQKVRVLPVLFWK